VRRDWRDMDLKLRRRGNSRKLLRKNNTREASEKGERRKEKGERIKDKGY